MNTNTWTVITFDDEQYVSAVPTSWLLHEDSMCFWPSNYTNKQVLTAIEKCESPEETWKKYRFTGFRNNVYDTLREANNKVKKAMVTSELESDAALSNKRRRKNYSSSSESDSDKDLIKRKNKFPRFPPLQTSQVSQKQSVPAASHSNPQTPTPTDMSNRIDAIDAKLVNSSDRRREDEERSSLYTSVSYLPINCDINLVEFENYLSVEENMKNAVEEISSLGGNDVYDLINRASKKFITNRFCGAEYSYIGKRDKKAFHVLKLNELLTKSAMRSFPNLTVKDVESIISKWIRRCTERGRKEKSVI